MPLSAALDSSSVFQDRVRELRLDSCWAGIVARQWDSFGSFAWCLAKPPGMNTEKEFEDSVVAPLTGEANSTKTAALRRLHFEAFLMTSSDAKRQLDRTGDEPPSTLPLPERIARRKRSQIVLGEANPIAGDLEPAHGTVDLACQMYAANIPSRIAWEDCPTRAMERELGAKQARTKFRKQGDEERAKQHTMPFANVACQLSLIEAMQRRGVALEEANAMSYPVHEKINRRFLRAMKKSPNDPRYEPPSLERIEEADMKFWELMEERAVDSGIRVRSDGSRPMDGYAKEIIDCAEMALLLQPLPRAGKPPPVAKTIGRTVAEKEKAHDPAAGLGTSKGALRRRKQARQIADLKGQLKGRGAPQPRVVPTPVAGAAAAGKARGKGTPNLPTGLIGMASRTEAGDPCCFSFNLPAGCTGAAAGARCPRGMHVCMRPTGAGGKACGAPHSQANHV